MTIGIFVSIMVAVFFGVTVALRFQSSKFLEKYMSRLFEVQQEVSDELDRQQSDTASKLDQLRIAALLEQQQASDKAAAEQQSQMEQGQAMARAKFEQIANYFRKTLNADATTKVLAAAYQYAASGPTPRNIKESELIQAVVEHEKAGSPYMENPPTVGKVQDSLN